MIEGLLFCAALVWALREGGRYMRRSVVASRTAARTRATSGGPRTSRAAVARRAARQATAGWILRELFHGFPVLRHGVSAGWAQHQHALADRHRLRVKQDAAHAVERAKWDREMALHWQRMEDARRAGTTGPPPRTTARRPAAPPTTPTVPVPPPPPAPAAPATSPGGPPGDGSTTTTSGGPVSGGEANYDAVLETCGKIVSLADEVAANGDLATALTMTDQLGAMVPGDGTTLGAAGDLAAAIKATQTAIREVQERATALSARVSSTYGAVKEAKEASGEKLPEKEFVES